jgi:hypothetical protein
MPFVPKKFVPIAGLEIREESKPLDFLKSFDAKSWAAAVLADFGLSRFPNV